MHNNLRTAGRAALAGFFLVQLAAAQSGNLGIKSGVIDFSAAGSTQVLKVVANIAALPGTCADGAYAYVLAEAAGAQTYSCKSNAWSLVGGTTVTVGHSFSCRMGNFSALTPISTGETGCYWPVGAQQTGTINAVTIIGNAAGGGTCSMTVDIDAKTGAFPNNSSDKISAAAPATLSAANTNFAGSVGTWSPLAVVSTTMFNASVATNAGSCVYAVVVVYWS